MRNSADRVVDSPVDVLHVVRALHLAAHLQIVVLKSKQIVHT